VCFGHMKIMDCHTEDTKNEGGKYHIYINHRLMCEEQHMYNKRIWNIKHGVCNRPSAKRACWTTFPIYVSSQEEVTSYKDHTEGVHSMHRTKRR
jgi:hypothetical protein